MKKIFLYSVTIFLAITCLPNGLAVAQSADSVFVFAYSTGKNDAHNGLHFAWSRDAATWTLIGNEHSFVRSDFGRWGADKRMYDPFFITDGKGGYHLVWSLNNTMPWFATAPSPDLLYWGRQNYPRLPEGFIFTKPVVKRISPDNYTVDFTTAEGKTYRLKTTNFISFSAPEPTAGYDTGLGKTTLSLPNGSFTGHIERVPLKLVDALLTDYNRRQYLGALYGQTTAQDKERFSRLQPLKAHIKLEPEKSYPISDMLMGIFFEDINYAADGGLYAELIQNRDFEYNPSDKQGRDPNWNSRYAWKISGSNIDWRIDSLNPIHENNPHYSILVSSSAGGALQNTGFGGISLKKGEAYLFSLFTKKMRGNGNFTVRLKNEQGDILASKRISNKNTTWTKKAVMLVPSGNVDNAILEIGPDGPGSIALDMVSLFPQNTFRKQQNGLRADLAQSIADIKPRFIRFPGGCVAHGDGLGNIYNWKNTVGPLEARVPNRNIWNYHQSAGLGYYEYFRFCEDIGAAPLPVIAAGVPCQNSAHGGQQGGVPMEKMDEYVQDILDLVEWANGAANTKWGSVRAAAGHPKPFNLKYIGIGNEDLITDVFEERFTMIFNALKARHPEITVIGTVGPFYEGTDYVEGWKIADKLKVPMVDEHYYQSPGWFIHNQDFYDKYDRDGSKVYLGEYASHLPGRPNNLETALSEALYLTALERNADVVHMSSYAPLLAKEGNTQWNPNLIYFNNTEVKPTVGYEVQKLYGNNAGTQFIPSVTTLSSSLADVLNRFASSVVRDPETGDVIIKIVNMLPKPVNTEIDLSGVGDNQKSITKTELKGDPAERNIQPVTSIISYSEASKLEFPPYSFTVLRFSK